MIYAMMIGGVLIYAALGFICWALCKAKAMYEREQERARIMARLTERTEYGQWWLKGLPWQSIFEGHELTRTDHRLLYGALCKLRDYEDTGLEPEDVRAQRAENQLLKDALAKSAMPGKWMPVDGAVDMARCSVCGECADIGWEPLTKYAKEHRFCSHCGAKMDGGKQDAD